MPNLQLPLGMWHIYIVDIGADLRKYVYLEG